MIPPWHMIYNVEKPLHIYTWAEKKTAWKNPRLQPVAIGKKKTLTQKAPQVPIDF